MDALDGGDRLAAERERIETARALERATLRHAGKRGGGGAWASTMSGLKGLDDGIAEAQQDRATREANLRRKILAQPEPDDRDSSDGSDEDDDALDPRVSAFDELAALERREQDAPAATKGLLGASPCMSIALTSQG